MNEHKQWMYGDEYLTALTNYVVNLDDKTKDQLLADYMFEYMENHMTNEQIQMFIETGEW